MRSFLLALSFLTILPTPKTTTADIKALGKTAVWYPMIGLIIGGLLAAVSWGLDFLFPSLTRAALILCFWAGISGGLHLDGLADCGDAFWASLPRQRRLEIMKDPHLGTFGGLSLGLALFLKFSLLHDLQQPLIPLLLAPFLARFFVLFLGFAPRASTDGLGHAFLAGISPATFLWNLPLLIAPASYLGAPFWLIVLVCLLVTGGMYLLARVKIGGVTGDVLGMTIEILELTVLFTFLLIELHPLAGLIW